MMKGNQHLYNTLGQVMRTIKIDKQTQKNTDNKIFKFKEYTKHHSKQLI